MRISKAVFVKLAAPVPLPYGHFTMAKNIVIYNDEGVGEFCLHCTSKFFEPHGFRLANAEDIIDGSVLRDAALFVIPGGADKPYARKLNGRGNANIRNFVDTGGIYLGLCAGAYYGCRALEFHKGRPDEVVDQRDLALIDAVAYGSLPDIARYYDLTPMSANITTLSLPNGKSFEALYYGGPAFRFSDKNIEILASYAAVPGNPSAIISAKHGKGRVILSGVHLEITGDLFATYPYANNAEQSHIANVAQQLNLHPSAAGNFLKDLLGF